MEKEAKDEAKKKLKQMTKDDLIASIRQCFKIYHAYIGLRNRYDSLKATIDILKNENTGMLQAVKEIERLYAESQKDIINNKAEAQWDMYISALPPEAWVS